MQVILIAFGTMGDVFPIIGLGKTIRERGHRVRFVTLRRFAEDVAGAGLEFHELAAAETLADSMARSADEGAQAASRWSRFSRTMEYLYPLPAAFYQLIEELYVPGETIIATNSAFVSSTLGATAVASERLGVPTARVWVNALDLKLLAPYLRSSLTGSIKKTLVSWLFACVPATRALEKRYEALRRQLGLKSDSDFLSACYGSQELDIGLFPRWFAPWCAAELPGVVTSDFSLYHRENDEALHPSVEEFLSQGDKPVLVTNASWRRDVEEFFQRSIQASEAIGVRVILLSKRMDELRPIETNGAMGLRYAPLKQLLPRVAGIVHHGGIGTIALAMSAGVPQLIVPWVYDHRFNARRVQELGVGLVTSEAEYLRRTQLWLRKLLESEMIRAKCVMMSSSFGSTPALSEALGRLENLISRHRAIAGTGTSKNLDISH